MSQAKRISLLIGSWNVNVQNPTKDELAPWLNEAVQQEHSFDTVDMFVFTFQEVALCDNENPDPKKRSYLDLTNYGIWKTELLSLINDKRKTKVDVLWSGIQGGTMLLIIAEEKFKKIMTDIQHINVEVGRSKTTIKGAICVSFNLEGSRVCLVGTHLTADQEVENNEQRIKDYHTIFSSSFGHSKVADHDTIFWFGDLNFRINLPRAEIMQHIKEKKWDLLSKCDQLVQAKDSGLAFTGFIEGKLSFHPTYKFEIGSDNYDLSESPAKRVPAWCDRVLWKSNTKCVVTQHIYTCANLNQSDHKPITSVFTLSF